MFETHVLPPLLLLVGGVLLWWGGDRLVQHAAHLAASFRVPKHVVGAVVLGFGTSIPELLVCLAAAFTDEPGIAVGNVVGSNAANVGLILGLGAVMAPTAVEPRLARLDLPLVLVAGGVLSVLLLPDGGELGAVAGGVLLAVFAGYLALSLRLAAEHRRRTRDEPLPPRRTGRDVAWIAAGLVVLAVGAHWFVQGAVGVAALLRVPSEIVGLSLVAVGTSLPELVTTVQAARQGHPELAVGNVAGSNVFNLFLVLGATTTLRATPVSHDMALATAAMTVFAFLALPLWGRGESRIPRAHGVVLLVAYAGYVGWLFLAGHGTS